MLLSFNFSVDKRKNNQKSDWKSSLIPEIRLSRKLLITQSIIHSLHELFEHVRQGQYQDMLLIFNSADTVYRTVWSVLKVSVKGAVS